MVENAILGSSIKDGFKCVVNDCDGEMGGLMVFEITPVESKCIPSYVTIHTINDNDGRTSVTNITSGSLDGENINKLKEFIEKHFNENPEFDYENVEQFVRDFLLTLSYELA